MEQKKIRRIPALALSAALVLATGSITAFAAWRYLTPDSVAEHFNDQKLADAFTGPGAVSINEVQSYGGYDVTFLGIVSGDNLTDYPLFANGSLSENRTYLVIAIENSDKTPMPDTSDAEYNIMNFFASVLIKGYEPWFYNTALMNGAITEFTEDGITYRMVECDNVEMFADCGLYLCVSDGGAFYNQDAYQYDEVTGEITRNESYTGLNALFDLPIDASKGDPEAAEKYLESLFSQENDREEDGILKEVMEWAKNLTPENIDEYCKVVESTVSVLTPDKEGYISYEYEVEGRGSSSGILNVPMYFQDGPQTLIHGCSGAGLASLKVEVMTLNEDGTVTFAVYIPKEF